ncbi:MAG: D-alanine--D-alanine ligase [Patescibacteria group bacterium]|nr:D-alanine--D-alanine ligase [Patescibacteria group bacterium]
MKKIRVGIIFGGKSVEHEVSLQSAKNIYAAIDREKYEPMLIGVDKKGKWLVLNSQKFLIDENNPKNITINNQKSYEIIPSEICHGSSSIDVAFPVIHGPYGEDGTLQGLLKLADIPFVGAGVLGSAIGMDKDITKRLLRESGIPIGNFLVFHQGKEKPTFEFVKEKLGLPFFLKPANTGSSVGINKVHSKEEFDKAYENALQYDNKIMAEEYIQGKELECSVLGNDKPIASVVGEVIPRHEFYSYEAKYLDENGAFLEIPAKISKELSNQVKKTAVQVFEFLECEGMARVDFFLRKDSKIFVNEINTIPGFTSISMYPRLWEASGVSLKELISQLIKLAIERHGKERKIKTDYLMLK